MSVFTRNTNLNEHFFYADDKRVCCQSIIDENISTREFARRHKLNPSRIGKWMRAFKQSISGGQNTLYDDHGGRPNIVDDIGVSDITNFFKISRRKQDCATPAVLNATFLMQLKRRLKEEEMLIPKATKAARTRAAPVRRKKLSSSKAMKTRTFNSLPVMKRKAQHEKKIIIRFPEVTAVLVKKSFLQIFPKKKKKMKKKQHFCINQ